VPHPTGVLKESADATADCTSGTVGGVDVVGAEVVLAMKEEVGHVAIVVLWC